IRVQPPLPLLVVSRLSVICAVLHSYCHRAHRDLPAFPTRRSSDLMRARSRRPPRRPSPSGRVSGSTPTGRSSPTKTSTSWRPRRSEEHTSELQSRVDLVCRLLLEKKKHATTT